MNYEIYRKSKVHKLIEAGEEFFIVDMEKKKVYNASDLRLREIDEKLQKENTFIVREC